MAKRYLVEFLRSFPLATPMQRRVEKALQQWPSVTMFDMLEAALAETDAAKAELAEVREKLDELEDELAPF